MQDVVAYANQCKRELGVTKLPKWINCTNGTLVPITTYSNPLTTANFPALSLDGCDRPPWVKVDDLRCAQRTYIHEIPLGGNTTSYLLCRQPLKRPVTHQEKVKKYKEKSSLNNFEDVFAFSVVDWIWVNKSTGKTCIFERALNELAHGGIVPSPDNTAKPDLKDLPSPKPGDNVPVEFWKRNARTFWEKPYNIGTSPGRNCLICHAASQTLVSPWLAQTGIVKPLPKDLPYILIGDAFKEWSQDQFLRPKAIYTDDVVKLKDGFVISKEKQQCTSCHRISPYQEIKLEQIKYSTGLAIEGISGLGSKMPLKYSMPYHSLQIELDWEKKFRDHVETTYCCMSHPRAIGCRLQTLDQPNLPITEGSGRPNIFGAPRESCFPPLIAGVNPEQGPTSGNTKILVRGEYFTEGVEVSLGKGTDFTECKNKVVTSPNHLTCYTPPHAPGKVDVKVTGSFFHGRDGTKTDYTIVIDAFEYIDPTPTPTGTFTDTPIAPTVTPTVTPTITPRYTSTFTPIPPPTATFTNTPRVTITYYPFWTPTATPTFHFTSQTR